MNNIEDLNYRREKREKLFDKQMNLETRIKELEYELKYAINERDVVMKDNVRLRKGIERLFKRIESLENAER